MPATPDPPPPGEDRVPPALALGLAVVLGLLLTVWAGFLVPVRVRDVPVPLWLVPFGVMVAICRAATRSAGRAAVLAPGMVWLTVTWLMLATVRAEGDLVVPATPAGYAYLGGGLLVWLVVIARADHRPPPHPASSRRPARSATPAGTARR